MKKIIKGLERELEKLRLLVQKREDKVFNMSEKWQESEKCEEWEDLTLDIDSGADDLESLILELKDLL